jgi:flagellar biosynthesis protein FlhA
MADAPGSRLPATTSFAATPGGGPSAGGTMAAIAPYFRGDVIFALAIVMIILFMLIPVPTFLLDFGLSISVALSVMILMTVLFIQHPLDFSTFPTVLLVATSLRLALNVASVRLILENGHEGPDAAGHVIEAFGTFIVGGEYVIGTIVFAILVIVNFVVITKGSGRIAEVAARFTLDAMPGKQMAIDADMSAGLITEDEAKMRRKKLEQESTFYGAMDGAAKFVRGDAIAGLLDRFRQRHRRHRHRCRLARYVAGRCGEELHAPHHRRRPCDADPGLIVSVSAGLLVSKAGVEGSADQALFDQFSRYPRAMAMSAGLIAALGLVPAIPAAPFLTLAAVIGGLAYMSSQRQALAAQKEIEAKTAKPVGVKPAEEPISKALAMDTIRLELGYGLLPLVQGEGGNKLTDQIKGLRRQLAEDMGYVLPAVRIQDNLQLPASTYTVRIKEIESGRGEVRPGMLMCMDPTGSPISLPGESTTEPTFGLPAMWIDERYREEAHFKGYTVVDAPTVITTHLTEIIKDNMPDLLNYAETQKLLNELGQEYQKLVADVVPTQVSVGGLQRVLQRLLSERVSVRDMPAILEGIAEAAAYTKNTAHITEHVRSRLARQLCDSATNNNGVVPLVTMSPEWEQAFAESLVGAGEDKQLAMPPSRLQEFIGAIRGAYERFSMEGEIPVLLTSPGIRPYVRSVIERFRPQTVVMSQNEIHPKARIRTLGQI